MQNLIDPIHNIIFAVSFLGILICLIEMYFHKGHAKYLILPVTYLINVFLYNLALHATLVWGIGNFSLHGLEIWSGIVRLHSLFLIIMLVIIQPARGR